MELKVKAAAKINLFLDVTGREKNGYHSIKSVMQSVSLFDVLTFSWSDGFSLSCTDPSLVCDDTNLVWRAADVFFDSCGIAARNVGIAIEKNIPMAAGLAGGSADCAAALVGLNAIYGSPKSKKELCELGAALGADVPFCIMCGTYVTEGIGEMLTKCPPMPDCPIVVAKDPLDAVSTPAAYKALDLLYGGFPAPEQHGDFEKMMRALGRGKAKECASALFNVFEEVVIPEHGSVSKIKAVMTDGGALASLMSGSGPSVFGIFENEKNARAVCVKLKNDGVFAAVCRPTKERQ